MSGDAAWIDSRAIFVVEFRPQPTNSLMSHRMSSGHSFSSRASMRARCVIRAWVMVFLVMVRQYQSLSILPRTSVIKLVIKCNCVWISMSYIGCYWMLPMFADVFSLRKLKGVLFFRKIWQKKKRAFGRKSSSGSWWWNLMMAYGRKLVFFWTYFSKKNKNPWHQ